MKKLITLNLFMLISFFVMGQGVTTSSMQGQISDQNKESLIGATIVATHTPTGSVYGTVTDESGYYRIDNMKVGGPYSITISYVGQEDAVYDQVFLRLGEPKRLSVAMGDSAIALDEIVVLAVAGSVGQNSGTSTQIGEEAIESMPTLNRNLTDYTRLTPQASGNSFGGINNRYNAIYVDGAVNNDVFGLAGSGTNGGQTGIAPFSIDIIDQLQVVLSPYDVTYGGFAGAGINAVTKSGTNTFSGTAYGFIQNQAMVGKTNQLEIDRIGGDAEREKVADFTKTTYGASLGGPIIKDKVFFFTNVEIQNDETPSPFNVDLYTNEEEGRATEADLNQLSDHLINEFGYDPGTFGDVSTELKGVKLFGKLDFNLNQDHKLTLRHQYTKAEEFDRFSGNADNINFSNNGIFFPSTTNSSALELNSNFNNKMSNNLIIGYTTVNDDRDPLGNPFPYVAIDDGDEGTIIFGSERFSTANVLEQKIFTLTDNFKIYKGKHTLTFGTHNEFYNIRNVFLPYNFGQYEFNSLDDFYNGAPADFYQRVYSILGNDVSGDDTNAAADFNAMQLGFYAQDEISINNNFTLTAGLRVDIPILTQDPLEAPGFNEQTVPIFEAEYPEFAGQIVSGQAPEGQLMFSPRLGFNYKVNSISTLRGGVGIFTSRIPFVWPGAMYNTNGATSAYVNNFGLDDPVTFEPGINAQYELENPNPPVGDANLFTKDFKYPQVLKTNIGYDTEIGNGWNTSIEASFTKTLNNVRYTNLNTSSEITGNFTGSGDDRPIYDRTEIDTTGIAAVYLGSNTSEGYGYNLTATVNKNITPDLNIMLAYTFGDAHALFEGTSSQNSSQWRGSVNVDGRNNPAFGRSDFALGNRILGVVNYKVDWANNLTTTISLLYTGESGNAISYVIGGDRDARNLNNESGSTSRWRSLVYVPADVNDINLVDITRTDEIDGVEVETVVSTAAEQWENLNAFIEDDPHLSSRRGNYAEKNGGRAPWVNFLDLAIRQDFSINAGETSHRLQASFDVFNIANLINPSWGVRYNVPGDFNNYELLNFVDFDADGTTPLYQYSEDALGNDTYNVSSFSSRWQARVGLRYIFN